MKETYKNYFSPKTAAARYAKGRPQFHSFVIGRIEKFLDLKSPFIKVLDVGCGTGFSSLALKTISEKVFGVDISAEMLRYAKKINGIEYAIASAENLPFGDAAFDAITISQAIHWVDKAKFYIEADRVLKPNAMIIAYDNYFQGKMVGNPAFNDWYRSEFLENYPIPPRGERTFESTDDNLKNFVLHDEEYNENTIEFSAKELVDYMVTISNVIARVENGNQEIDEVYQWLITGVESFFEGVRKDFTFINPIWFLRRNN